MIRVARFLDLDPTSLYGILRLRAAVFAVEQDVVYNDLDGKDLDATVVWAEEDGAVVSALRLLPGSPAVIGRVVTAPTARHRGLAGSLIDRAIDLVPAGTAIEINAQARLEPWYQRWGFVRSGPDNLEDGLVHVPMTRPAGKPAAPR